MTPTNTKSGDLKPRITVIGVGGAGGNAVNNMIAAGLSGVEFMVANTDAQALHSSKCPNRVQLGINLTEGLGAGSKPEIGEAAAREAEDDLRAHLVGTHMLFVAAGMGGGTGTGAAAVVAKVARDLGILTIAVVTKPFTFEGTKRMRTADAGILELRQHVDTLIVIPNQNLFRIATEKTTFSEAFLLADQVLYSGIACIVDLIVKDGLINLDLADVRTVLTGMGQAVMGTGEASGDRRAVQAAEEAISNQLLDNMSLAGARGLLLSIIGGPDMTLYEVDEAASRVRAEVDPDANIIVGAAFDASMKDRVRVSIVASGMPGVAASAAPSLTGAVSSHVSPRAATPDSAQAAPPAIAPVARSPVAPPPLAQPPLAQPPLAQHRAVPPPLPVAAPATRSGDEIRVRETGGNPEWAVPLEALPASESRYEPASQFAAKPIVEPRRQHARAPEVADLPPIGQKEYVEKRAQLVARGQLSAEGAPTGHEPPREEPKKGRLFQRLAEAALGRPKAADSAPLALETEQLPEFFARERRG
jgi:cell division protein FtsZ